LELIAQSGAQEGDADFEAELKVLEVHHGDVGALVAEHWRLPDSIVAAVRYHHTPDRHPDPICYAVALGDMVADYLMGPGIEVIHGQGQRVPVIEDLGLEDRWLDRLSDALVELHINPDGCHELVYATAERYIDVRSRYLIDDED
jgi:hypothetical protein